MDAAATLRAARQRAGLSQAALARAAGTSQATLSAYERGRKEPSVRTLDRLLQATGMRLGAAPIVRRAYEPAAAELERAGRTLADVLALAEALPTRHHPVLRYPRLPAAS